MKKILVLLIVFILLLVSFIFIPETDVNYDMTSYLPNDSMTKQGIAILEEEFGKSAVIQVMVNDIDVTDLILLKQELYLVSDVYQVVWLDDFVDLNLIPIEFLEPQTVAPFYTDGDALLTILFALDAYDLKLETRISEIESIFDDYEIHMRGEALVNIESRNIALNETYKIMFLIVPIVILLLILSSHTWFEPVLILITLGIAILFNLFTNGLLPDVSFITQTMSLALQLALSIDYAIFIIHRYYEERENNNAHDAAILSLKHSIKPIATSALTTIAGFAALMFMKFSIGTDIAVVLSKGIIFSFAITIIVMPMLLIWFDKLLMKTKHKMLIPPFKHLIRFELKLKYVLLVLFILLAGFGFIVQRNVDYLFGANSIGEGDTQTYIDSVAITETFGPNEQIVIIIPNETINQEVNLSGELIQIDGILNVSALVNDADPNIPREFLPVQLVSQYVGTHYSRMIVTISLQEENQELFDLVEEINQTIKAHYDEYYIVGQASALVDIKSSIEDQGIWIMLLTILSVGLIVGFIFKSVKIPLLLVGVILTAIWINLSVLSLSNINVLYIGYLVVMSIQLGATIDYAVLLTHRYLEEGIIHEKEKAIEIAFTKSSLSIIISGAILSIAGFVEGIFSDIDSVAKIGYLLGRGVFISLISI
ncbi:MAG: MMPL family transporter, partial [Acholeplasmataceae bacterium]|nr:MMPL family transporter [Acholeplasmataceae bacterium]